MLFKCNRILGIIVGQRSPLLSSPIKSDLPLFLISSSHILYVLPGPSPHVAQTQLNTISKTNKGVTDECSLQFEQFEDCLMPPPLTPSSLLSFCFGAQKPARRPRRSRRRCLPTPKPPRSPSRRQVRHESKKKLNAGLMAPLGGSNTRDERRRWM